MIAVCYYAMQCEGKCLEVMLGEGEVVGKRCTIFKKIEESYNFIRNYLTFQDKLVRLDSYLQDHSDLNLRQKVFCNTLTYES